MTTNTTTTLKHTSPRSVGKLSIAQVNLRHSIAAWENAMCKISAHQTHITCIQEPYVHNNKFRSPPQGFEILFCPQNNPSIKTGPRACIVVKKELESWLVPQLSTPDVVTCLIKNGNGGRPLAVIAGYCDILLDPVPDIFSLIVKKCKMRRWESIWCLDTNAHSPFFGSADRNYRGEQIEEFIIQAGLLVENIGNTDTFVSGVGKSVIDVTLTSQSNAKQVLNWEVSLSTTMSDHRLIKFEYDSSPHTATIKYVRKYNKVDWSSFESSLESIQWDPPASWNANEIESQLTGWYQDLFKIMNDHCPEVPIKLKSNGTWWTHELKEAKKLVRKAEKQAVKSRSTSDWESFREKLKTFKNLVLKTKETNWRSFNSEAGKSEKSTARLIKKLQYGAAPSVGMNKDILGFYARSPDDAINSLFNDHFPNSEKLENLKLLSKNNSEFKDLTFTHRDISLKALFNPNTVARAFKEFSKYSSPGPDGVSPQILQNLSVNFLERLHLIFSASINCRYVPVEWRKSKVIFIPKIGKPSYTKTKDFRPITLSSFVFKALERIVYWHLENYFLPKDPISTSQNAFKRGYGTETAATTLTDSVESALAHDEYAMTAYLDLAGAFDNIHVSEIIKAMKEKRFPSVITDWADFYLQNRVSSITIKGNSATRTLNRGTPQGSVLSPLFFNMAMDGLLTKFGSKKQANGLLSARLGSSTNPVKIIGYADDTVLIIKGKDLPTMASTLQQSLNIAQRWAAEAGLTFSPDKSQAIIFTRKRMFKSPPNLTLHGKPIEYVKKVKYLGVTFTQNLDFKDHILEKINKCRSLIYNIHRLAGFHWGPSPALARWCYTAIVRPTLTYCCLVWWRSISSLEVQRKLKTLNRLCLVYMAPVRKSTPTAALEIIYNIPPLDLFIRDCALKAFVRVNRVVRSCFDGVPNNGSKTGLFLDCQKEVKKILQFPVDWYDLGSKELRMLDSNYKFDRSSLTDGVPLSIPTEDDSTYYCFTDGSLKNGLAGGGFVIYSGNSLLDKVHFHLGRFTSVFQAEVSAIRLCVQKLHEYDHNERNIVIHCDSRAAIDALCSNTISSPCVKYCNQWLNSLSARNTVTLRWVKAHVGNEQNEVADSLAKMGTEPTVPGCDPSYLVAPSHLKESFSSHLNNEWKHRWNTSNTMRQAKIFIKGPDNSIFKSHLAKQDRETTSRFIQLITGHAFLLRHQKVVGLSATETCRLCQDKAETGIHILYECPELFLIRRRIMGSEFVSPTTKPVWFNILNMCKQRIVKKLLNPDMETLIPKLNALSGDFEPSSDEAGASDQSLGNATLSSLDSSTCSAY